MLRRFEFVSGPSAKFWEITTSGAKVTVRFGRLGTDGQVQAKSFATPEAATRHTDKVVAEKPAKATSSARSASFGEPSRHRPEAGSSNSRRRVS